MPDDLTVHILGEGGKLVELVSSLLADALQDLIVGFLLEAELELLDSELNHAVRLLVELGEVNLWESLSELVMTGGQAIVHERVDVEGVARGQRFLLRQPYPLLLFTNVTEAVVERLVFGDRGPSEG